MIILVTTASSRSVEPCESASHDATPSRTLLITEGTGTFHPRDVRSSPMAYPDRDRIMVSYTSLSLSLHTQRCQKNSRSYPAPSTAARHVLSPLSFFELVGSLVRLRARPERHREQSSIALRSPASERPSDLERYSPDIHQNSEDSLLLTALMSEDEPPRHHTVERCAMYVELWTRRGGRDCSAPRSCSFSVWLMTSSWTAIESRRVVENLRGSPPRDR